MLTSKRYKPSHTRNGTRIKKFKMKTYRDNRPQFIIEGDRRDVPESQRFRDGSSQTNSVIRREKYSIRFYNVN